MSCNQQLVLSCTQPHPSNPPMDTEYCTARYCSCKQHQTVRLLLWHAAISGQDGQPRAATWFLAIGLAPTSLNHRLSLLYYSIPGSAGTFPGWQAAGCCLSVAGRGCGTRTPGAAVRCTRCSTPVSVSADERTESEWPERVRKCKAGAFFSRCTHCDAHSRGQS